MAQLLQTEPTVERTPIPLAPPPHARPAVHEVAVSAPSAAERPQAHAAPRQLHGLPLTAWLYIGIMFAGWAAMAVYAVNRLSLHDAWTLLPVAVLTALVQRFGLGLYVQSSFVTFGMVGSLAAGMLYGVPGVVFNTTVAMLTGQFSVRRPHRILFNLGSITVSNAAAMLVFSAGDRLIPGGDALTQAPGALLAGLVSYLCSSALLTLMLAITQHRHPRQVWAENFRWLVPHMMGFGLLALGLTTAYRTAGVAGLLAFSGPALLMRYAMKQYLDRTTRSVRELSARNDELEQANGAIAAMSARLQETYVGTLEALVAALDARDRETYGHSTRVSQMTMVLARHMGVPEGSQQWTDIERGALLHDVGKIGVTDAILRKPGALTEAEWVDMRRHSRIGYDVLKDIPFLSGAAELVAAHHERWDGGGYPQGLAGEQIPLGARMFMVADTFDAMATDRPYRRARPYADCLEEIVRCAGSQFDPAVVEALVRVYPQWTALHRESLARAGAGPLSKVA